jgi:hypothetical protein
LIIAGITVAQLVWLVEISKYHYFKDVVVDEYLNYSNLERQIKLSTEMKDITE